MSENSTLCECAHWPRAGNFRLFTKHHIDCEKYNPIAEVREVLTRLIRGMECWASDEDGIHPEAWEAYADAKMMLGENVRCRGCGGDGKTAQDNPQCCPTCNGTGYEPRD